MPAPSPLIFRVSRLLAHQRADVVFTRLFNAKRSDEDRLSRGQAVRLMREGVITRNRFPVRPADLVDVGDVLTLSGSVWRDFRSEAAGRGLGTTKIPKGLEPKVLWENDDFLILDKPAGLTVHPTKASHSLPTLADWIIQTYPKLRSVGEHSLRPSIVHRLDRETSGAMVVAKTQESFQRLKTLFQQRKIEKHYVALVYGHLPLLEGNIDVPLLRRKGSLKHGVADADRLKKKTRSAVTGYRVIRRYRDYDCIVASPKTGRTHQIRVHMAALRHPIVGDKWYAFKPERRLANTFPSRHLLHSMSLSFVWKEKTIRVASPLPEDFRTYLRGIDETTESRYDDKALGSLFG